MSRKTGPAGDRGRTYLANRRYTSESNSCAGRSLSYDTHSTSESFTSEVVFGAARPSTEFDQCLYSYSCMLILCTVEAVTESAQSSGKIRMSDYKVGQHVNVKLSGGRLVDAEIKAIIETTEGKRLQVSFGDETARICLWQVVERIK